MKIIFKAERPKNIFFLWTLILTIVEVDFSVLSIIYFTAGIMFAPYKKTVDGLEEHFQVNYLSHFYLTLLLIDVLKDSGTDNSHSRIVNLTSVVHKVGNIDIDNLCKR